MHWRNTRIISNVSLCYFSIHTSSLRRGTHSGCKGLGMERPGPGRDTFDRRLFLTPLQLFGILKAHRLW
jgi:hypothetical protein